MLNLRSKPQSHTEIFGTAFEISKKTFSSVLPYFIGFALISYSFSILTYWIELSRKNNNLGMAFAGLVITLVLLFLSYNLLGAAIYRIHSIAKAKDPGLGQAFSYGANKVIPLFIVGFLYTCAVLLGGVLLIIPGIIIAIYWLFAIYLIYLDFGIIDSFKESYRLVKDNWWRTLINILLLSIVFLLIGILFVGIIAIIAVGLQVMLGEAVEVVDHILMQIFVNLCAIIVMIFIYSFSISFMLSCIYDLQNRKKSKK